MADIDGNDATRIDASWTPALPTPNHPEYPAAHSCTAGSLGVALQHFYGTPNVTFTWDSTVTGTTRSYAGVEAFSAEAGIARIHGGMHFTHAIVAGEKLEGASPRGWPRAISARSARPRARRIAADQAGSRCRVASLGRNPVDERVLWEPSFRSRPKLGRQLLCGRHRARSGRMCGCGVQGARRCPNFALLRARSPLTLLSRNAGPGFDVGLAVSSIPRSSGSRSVAAAADGRIMMRYVSISGAAVMALALAMNVSVAATLVATYSFDDTLNADFGPAPALTSIDPLGANGFRPLWCTERASAYFAGRATAVHRPSMRVEPRYDGAGFLTTIIRSS